MISIYPVSPIRHQAKRWLRFSNYGFARKTALAPLAATEVAAAALALPLAFVKFDGAWSLSAVLGLNAGQNYYVAADGSWLAGYVPATFRAYPFCFGLDDANQAALCIDELSGLIVDGGNGEDFFDETGNIAPTVDHIWSFLKNVARGEELIVQISNALYSAGLIEPWPITVQVPEGTRQINEFHRINEAALSTLDDVAFNSLRRSGFISLAYAQLLSMGNLAQLGRLAQACIQAEAAEQARAEVKPMIALPTDSTIDWDWSKIGR